MKTVWRADCKTPGGGRHFADFDTEEQACAYAFGPESAGLIHLEQVTVRDPEAWQTREAEWRRRRRTSCLLPPASDLQLTAWAKRLPPERFDEINPAAGSFKRTRLRLHEIRSQKYNDLLRSMHHTP